MLAVDSRRSYDQIIRTTCGACPAGCGLGFYVKDGRVVDLLGDEAHPVNRGALCAKGSAFLQHFEHPARLRQPALRHALDQDFSPCSWDEALNFAAGRLKTIVEKHGPSAVAVATADRLDVGNLIGAARFAARLGAQWIAPVQSVPDAIAAEMFGPQAAPFLTIPPDEWAQRGCLLLLGGDPAVEYPVAFRHVLEARARQAPVMAVAARFTATSSKADLALQIRPGSEAVFILALVKVAFEEGLPDPALEMRRAGLDLWRAAAQELSWQAIERLTWLPEDSIRRAGLIWAAHQPGVVIGGGVVSSNMARAAAGLLALSTSILAAREISGGWNWLADPPWPFTLDGALQADPARESVSIKAVVGTGDFPTLEARDKVKAEFVAHFGAYPDEAQRHAHVTFPAASWAEVEGLHVGHDRRVQRHVAVVAPPGQAHAALEFWAGLADRLGLGDAIPWRAADGRVNLRAFSESLLAESPALAGMSVNELDTAGGVRWPRSTPSESDMPTCVSFGSPPDIATPELDPARPVLLCRDTPAEGDAAWWPWLHQGQDTAVFDLHPAVAAALGLENGDALVVDDGQRHYQGQAHLTHSVPMRTVWATAGTPRVASALVFRQQDHALRSLARLRVLFSQTERQA